MVSRGQLDTGLMGRLPRGTWYGIGGLIMEKVKNSCWNWLGPNFGKVWIRILNFAAWFCPSGGENVCYRHRPPTVLQKHIFSKITAKADFFCLLKIESAF